MTPQTKNKTKICTKCGIEKFFSEFFKDKLKKFGLRSFCKECDRIRLRNWKKNNKDKNNTYIKNRLRNDEQFKIKFTITDNLRHIFFRKRKGVIIKEQTYQKNLSCSEQEFYDYFEKHFYPHPDNPDIMMSWENYGKSSGKVYWEVDHKIPWKHFDLTDLFQQKKYNFLKNLQPLWRVHNRLKSDGIKEYITIPDNLKDRLKDFTEYEVYSEEDIEKIKKFMMISTLKNYTLEI